MRVPWETWPPPRASDWYFPATRLFWLLARGTSVCHVDLSMVQLTPWTWLIPEHVSARGRARECEGQSMWVRGGGGQSMWVRGQSKLSCHFIVERLCFPVLLLCSICLEASRKSSPYLWEGRYSSWNASVSQSLGVILQVAFHKNIFEMLSKYMKWARLHNLFVIKFLWSVLTSKQYTQWLVLIIGKSQQAIFLIW